MRPTAGLAIVVDDVACTGIPHQASLPSMSSSPCIFMCTIAPARMLEEESQTSSIHSSHPDVQGGQRRPTSAPWLVPGSSSKDKLPHILPLCIDFQSGVYASPKVARKLMSWCSKACSLRCQRGHGGAAHMARRRERPRWRRRSRQLCRCHFARRCGLQVGWRRGRRTRKGGNSERPPFESVVHGTYQRASAPCRHSLPLE